MTNCIGDRYILSHLVTAEMIENGDVDTGSKDADVDAKTDVS